MLTRNLSPLLFVLAACAPGELAVDYGALQLIFLDVGQGDAIVIRSPEGKVALVDAGPGVDVSEMLRRHGVAALDIAIATHPHADHIGGMADVLRSLPVRFYMDNGVPHTTQTYRELLRTLEGSDVAYLEATARTIDLGSVTLRVLPPPPTGENHNNRSIGLIVEHGAFSALLTGDSEVEELNYFLSSGVPDITLIKAAHHGARDAVTPAWIAATQPEIVVISCGRANEYGYPHPWALRYYESGGAEIYRTDRDGEVIITAWDDGRYSVITTRERALAIEDGR